MDRDDFQVLLSEGRKLASDMTERAKELNVAAMEWREHRERINIAARAHGVAPIAERELKYDALVNDPGRFHKREVELLDQLERSIVQKADQ